MTPAMLDRLDTTNPFIALGVPGREQSYSRVIAQQLFTNDAYLDALSTRLGLPAPLRFASVNTEVSIGRAGCLDILALEADGRAVVVETKVNAQVDPLQQARYVEEIQARHGERSIFLAFKLGPAVAPVCVPGFTLIDSAALLADLPPGEHMGLRGMLGLFADVEARLARDPMGPRKRRKARTADALDDFLLGSLSHSFYEFLFARFEERVDEFLPGHSMQAGFEITQHGGKILKYFEPGWFDALRGVQVHFELKDNERMALHVETEPYPSRDARLLANKTALARDLAQRLAGVPDLELEKERKKMAQDACTSIANVRLDFDDLDTSAQRFAAVYRRCAPIIDQLFTSTR